MLSHHIISRGMLNTGKWEAKQAYFTLIFTVSTGIKPNRKQPYFLSLSLSLRRAVVLRQTVALSLDTDKNEDAGNNGRRSHC